MNTPVRQPQDSERRGGALDPVLLRIIEALAEAQARRDYPRHTTTQAPAK